MDLKIIGIGALINATLTILLSLIIFPTLFLGPLIGGFFSSYFTTGYEDYAKMDEKDGAVVGAISGLIGGLIIALLYILGIGDLSALIGLISTKIGAIGQNTLILAYVIFEFSLLMSFIFGLIGGVIGVIAKE
jgi:hypothetical protein